MLLRLIVHRRLRYVITHRRIRTQPPRVLRIQIPCSVIIEPHARDAGYRACFILLLRRKRRNLAVAFRVLLCKTCRKSVRLPNMFFLCACICGMSLGCCWIVKEQNCKTVHGNILQKVSFKT